jgi:hypothetical protein
MQPKINIVIDLPTGDKILRVMPVLPAIGHSIAITARHVMIVSKVIHSPELFYPYLYDELLVSGYVPSSTIDVVPLDVVVCVDYKHNM